jgi:hypothetical protein
VFQHALDPCPPDLRPPAGDGPAGTAPPTPREHLKQTRGARVPASLGPALRLAADLTDRLGAADPGARITVSVGYRHTEDCAAAEFLAHGDDARRLASLAACSRLFDVALTVADPPPGPDEGRVWVGGSALRGGVRLSLHASFTDPAAVADIRRAYPAGTGGW